MLASKNVEFEGISERVNDSDLESTIIDILKKIGLDHIQHYHIIACHRIGEPSKTHPRSVIVRFLNRKDAIKCLHNKSSLYKCSDLGMRNISIHENDEIAAFYNQDVRGVAFAIKCPINNKLVFPMMIHSNDSDIDITFKYYDSINDREIDYRYKN